MVYSRFNYGQVLELRQISSSDIGAYEVSFWLCVMNEASFWF